MSGFSAIYIDLNFFAKSKENKLFLCIGILICCAPSLMISVSKIPPFDITIEECP